MPPTTVNTDIVSNAPHPFEYRTGTADWCAYPRGLGSPPNPAGPPAACRPHCRLNGRVEPTEAWHGG